jgi:Zn-dependent protease
MGWEDRGYNRGAEGGAEYLGNPAAFFNLSVPLGTWFGASIRLHFWLLLTILFAYMGGNIATQPLATTFACILTIASLLVHEFSHRIAAERVGGSYDHFLIWPPGGMTQPLTPGTPGAIFVAHGAGVLGSLILAIGSYLGLAAYHLEPSPPVSFGTILASFNIWVIPANNLPLFVCWVLYYANAGLVCINLTPFYVFDGGYIWEAALTNWLGRHRATNVTCIAGMVVAVPFFLLSLYFRSLLGIIFWIFLFASAFNKRRELVASGGDEFESAIAMSAQDRGPSPARRKRQRWPAKDAIARAAREAAAERKEQEQIDSILAKVHARGMQSLTWMERRALKQATERQRRRAGGR